MRRTERRHLKQNEVATWVGRAAELMDQRRGTLLTVAGLTIAALLAWGGTTAWQARSDAAASEIVAEAMGIMNAPVAPPAPAVPPSLPIDDAQAAGPEAGDDAPDAEPAPTPAAPLPPPPGSYATQQAKEEAALVKFLEAAATQPNGRVGLTARYHAATILAGLGRLDEAAEHYEAVRAASSAGIYGEMARLGLAELDAMRGNYDAAITTWRDVAASPDGRVPADGALMQLAEVYTMAGNEAEAIETLNRIVNEFPLSQYATSAQQEIDRLEGRGVAPPRP